MPSNPCSDTNDTNKGIYAIEFGSLKDMIEDAIMILSHIHVTPRMKQV